MIKLLVFDLDGTLVDTLQDIGNSVNHALQKRGLQPLQITDIKACIGDGARILLQRCLSLSLSLSQKQMLSLSAKEPQPINNLKSVPEAHLPEALNSEDQITLDWVLAEFMEHYKIHFMVESRPYPGVIDSLGDLSGFKKAVLTNKPTGPAHQLLEGLNLAHHFDWILGGDNAWGPKPNPAALFYLNSLAGAKPNETVMIGDGIQDLQVARNAGTHFIGFLNGLGDRQVLMSKQPETTLETMQGLAAAIGALNPTSQPISGNGKTSPETGHDD